MIRTILFLILMYLLIKIISRIFLSSGTNKGRKSGARIFYQTFRQFQQDQQQQQQNKNRHKTGTDRFEEIEEAEFEDITEEDNSTAKSSD